ncbi:MAG: hypothetical protein O7J95_09550 [Planctomycetota bacterium]|nr:hypothetical protein [Planctomycetota bacterium]
MQRWSHRSAQRGVAPREKAGTGLHGHLLLPREVLEVRRDLDRDLGVRQEEHVEDVALPFLRRSRREEGEPERWDRPGDR